MAGSGHDFIGWSAQMPFKDRSVLVVEKPMSSTGRVAANRKNAKKSTGPRTRRGKSRASRNALQHGLEKVNFGIAGLSKKVQRLAKKICQDDSDPFRSEQAVIIAESQILIARVRAARVAALERPRTSVGSSPIRPSHAVADQGSARTRRVADGEGDARNLSKAAVPGSRRKKVLNCVIALLTVRLAMPELLSLERYERRALSRRKRAIRR